MMLHASQLIFTHPVTGLQITINAPLQPEFVRTMGIMGW
jgi:tRNA pseudouridine65 synthase